MYLSPGPRGHHVQAKQRKQRHQLESELVAAIFCIKNIQDCEMCLETQEGQEAREGHTVGDSAFKHCFPPPPHPSFLSLEEYKEHATQVEDGKVFQ